MRFALVVFLIAAFSAASLLGVEVSFHAVGRPSFLNIRGKCQGKVVKTDKIGDIKGKVGRMFLAEVDLASCDTGIDLRNRHMKENYLHTNKFPKAILEGTVWEDSTNFTGKLTVHGKPAEVQGELKDGLLKFKTTISSHGIESPGFKGITVADEVTIEAPLSF